MIDLYSPDFLDDKLRTFIIYRLVSSFTKFSVSKHFKYTTKDIVSLLNIRNIEPLISYSWQVFPVFPVCKLFVREPVSVRSATSAYIQISRPVFTSVCI